MMRLLVYISIIIPFQTSLSQEIAFQPPNNRACEGEKIVDRSISFGDYLILTGSSDEQMCHFIEIQQNKKTVYFEEDYGTHYTLGKDTIEETNPFLNLESNTTQLIFSKWTGGAHCCFSLYIFDLSESFKEIANIEGGNFHPELKDLNGDSIPEILVTDDILAYVFSSFAWSATGKVVLEYREGQYEVEPNYMIKAAPQLNSFSEKIQSWQNEILQFEGFDQMPYEFMQSITDLVYSGNTQAALDLIEIVWPSSKPGKVDFINE